MRIAVFLDNIYISKIRKGIKHVFLFEVDDDLIKAIGEEVMKINNINYVCLWLLGKRVKDIYYDGFSASEKAVLERSGMVVRPYNEIKSNSILQALLIKE